jgi:hypothetical protein
MALAEASASLPALIAGGSALVVAGISWIATRTNQSKLLEHQITLERYKKDLQRLQHQLDEQKSERDARRDYEYEARKRLYHECSPLLFQLTDQAASALSRIRGLAASASQGELDPGPNSWLTSSRDRYYRRSTEYRLLAPCATQKLLQQRLTRLDLTLDTEIYIAYTLARAAARVLGDDFDLAQAQPALAYDPHNVEAEERISSEPQVYRQQGVPRGILDNALEALIVREADGASRVMSFLEFERQLDQADSVVAGAVGVSDIS